MEIPRVSPGEEPFPLTTVDVYFSVAGSGRTECIPTKVYDLNTGLKAGMLLSGPSIILNETSTILVEPGCQAEIDSFGNVIIEVLEGASDAKQQAIKDYTNASQVPFDAIELSIFGHRFMSIAEQMGVTLQRTSVSTNIKERLDFSCALFDPEGNLVANAPHLPVHLGSM